MNISLELSMSGSNRKVTIGFVKETTPSVTNDGKLGLIMTVISAVLVSVGDAIYSPLCRQSSWPITLWEFGSLSSVIAILMSAGSVMVGLCTLRLRPITLGILPIPFSSALISAALRNPHPVEPPAVGHLRQVNTAEVTYLSMRSKYGSIEDLIRERLLDDQFAQTVAGYKFTVTAGENDYLAKGTNVTKSGCWDWDIFSAADAVVRYSTD